MKAMFSEFLIGTINQVTLLAALRRSNTYTDNLSENNKKREEFRKDLCKKMNAISLNYKNKVSEDKHIENIKQLQEYSKQHKSVLKGGKIKFGVAQKALNLYLKLLWSQGIVKEPPHCPLDSVIIKKLPSPINNINWTELTRVADYEKIISAIRKQAKSKKQSIACWELVAYHEKNITIS